MPFAQDDEPLAFQVRQRDGTFARERMARRQGQQQFFAKQIAHLKPRIGDGAADQRQVDFISQRQFQQARGGVFLHHDFHPGKLFREPRHYIRQQIRRDGRQHPDGQRAAQQTARIRRLAPGGVHFLQDFDRAAQKRFAMRGQAGLAFQPVKQAFAQFVLQLLNLLTQRGLGDVALLGGPGEVARARHGDHIAKLVHFHRQCLS